MAKKSFERNLKEQYEQSIAADAYYQQLAQSMGQPGQQTTAPAEEQRARASAMRTQGRKGCKAPRINMAFSTENYEYIRLCSRATGMSLTDYTNAVIDAYRKEHPEIYEKCKSALDAVNQLRDNLEADGFLASDSGEYQPLGDDGPGASMDVKEDD